MIPRLPSRRDRAPAFTLVEVLLVLSLFALFGALFIGGAGNLLDHSREQSPEQALLSMFQTVRRQAVQENRIIEVAAVEDGAAFVWNEADTLILPEREGVSVRLLKPQLDQAVLLGGQLEETPLERLRFYPDGTCDPVRVQIRRGQVRRVETIDPWTCSPQPPVGNQP
ncbi:MAG: GspH/FimT family pseudopilin [Verrucomicrobiota bacterium]